MGLRGRAAGALLAAASALFVIARASAAAQPSDGALVKAPAALAAGVSYMDGCEDDSLLWVSPQCRVFPGGKAGAGARLAAGGALSTGLLLLGNDAAARRPSPLTPAELAVDVDGGRGCGSSARVYVFEDDASVDYAALHAAGVGASVRAAEVAAASSSSPSPPVRADPSTPGRLIVSIPREGAWRILVVAPKTLGGDGELRVSLTMVVVPEEDSASASAASAASASLHQGPPTVTQLTSGTPVSGSVAYRAYAFYNLTVPVPVTRVDVSVTPLTGDPDLYVTVDGVGLPNTTHYQYLSSAFLGTDTVVVRGTDAGGAGFFCNATRGARSCTILIAVFGATFTGGTATFSVVATVGGGYSQLISSIPMIDTVPASDYNYYTLAGRTQGATLLFVATAITGDPDIYIGSSQRGMIRPKFNDPTTYCWRSNTARRDVVEVYPPPLDTTGCYCNGVAGCTYYIAVYGYPPADSTYTILGQENLNTTMTLLEGVPQTGLVGQSETDQYTYTIPAVSGGATSRRATAITISPLSGDPDVYVTLNGDVPGPARYDFVALGPEDGPTEYLTIRNSDPKVTNSPCAASNVSCTIRIAVYGFSQGITWYAVGASTSRAAMLSDGQPLADYVDVGQVAYFQFRVDNSNDPDDAILFTITPLGGDPDIFIGNSGNIKTLVPDPSDPSTYIWSGEGQGTDVVFIDPSDPNVVACGIPCTYSIAVAGYQGNASFTILAHSRDGRTTALVAGLPVVDAVEIGGYQRYTADYDPTAGMLEVTVTPLSGDPDLYIALDNRIVTLDNWQYASVSSSGFDDIVIKPTDKQFNSTCSLQPRGQPCTANIAVYGYTQAAYTIVASSGNLRVLQDGVPASGSAPGNGYTYYQFTVLNRALISITVSPTSNDPDVYISNTIKRPNSTSYTWQSATFGAEQVTIDPADSRASSCGIPCTYYIAVFGWRNPATFTITASTNVATFLPTGLPVQASAPAGGFAYFTFLSPADASGIEFILTPLSGAPDTLIFVGNDLDPTTGRVYFPTQTAHYSWTSGMSLARNEVQIPPTDPKYKPRSNYVVGIYSDSGATFILTGAGGNSIKTLTPSVPMQGSVASGQYTYFRLTSSTYGAGMSVLLTPLTGDPDLFVSANSSNPRPTSAKYDRKAVGSGVERISFQWTDLPECVANLSPVGSNPGSCSIYIAVFGYGANSTFTVVGDITYNSTQYTELVDGQPQGMTLAGGTWTYFYARVNFPPTQTYSVYVRTASGDPDLYIATDGAGLPTTTPPHYQYSSNHASGDEYVDIAPGTSGYNSSTIMVAGVYAWGTAQSTFTITYASASVVVGLAAGVAQSGFLLAGQYAYYSFPAAAPSQPTTWAVTALAGDPDIYVGVWPPLQQRYRPTVATHTWAAFSDSSDTIVIQPYPTDPGACRVSCNYIAGVLCANPTGGCRFSVSAVQGSGSTLIPLVDGQPASGTVRQGALAYYSLSVPAGARRNITVRVTTTLGSAQLYVTNAYDPTCQPTPCGQLPTNTAGAYIWSSSPDGGRTGSGIVNIGWADPNVAPFANSTTPMLLTIGVLGTQGLTTTFTVVASTSESVPTLIPGQPTTRQVISAGANAHFSVNVASTSSDLMIVATVLVGSVTVVLSSPARDPSRFGYPTCTTPRNCNATWTSITGARAGDTIRVYAPVGDGTKIGPCLGPYVYAGGVWPCSQNSDWVAGLFNIGVYGNTDSEYALTVYTSAGAQVLDDGQPQEGVSVPGNPATFLFRSQYSLTLPDVRFLVASDDTALVYYIRSCVEGLCQPADVQPGPSNFEDTGSVDAGGDGDFFVTKFASSYCSPGQGGICHYYVAVYPAPSATPCTDPTNPDCAATFTITASVQGGSQPTLINFNSVNNRVYSLSGNVAPGSAAVYELYLNASRSADIVLDVDACGPGYPNVYVCNPNPAGATPACTNPFAPSAAQNTMSGSTQASGGTVRLLDLGVQAQTYFIAVAADGTSAEEAVSRRLAASGARKEGGSEEEEDKAVAAAASSAVAATVGQSGGPNWAYNLMLSSGQAYYLTAGSSPLAVVSSSDGTSVNVSFGDALIVDQERRNAVKATSAQYLVVAAAGGFPAAAAGAGGVGVVPTTACGLFRFSSLARVEPVGPTARGQTYALVTGLQPGTYYEFGVIAQCDNACFAAAGVAPGGGGGGGGGIGPSRFPTQWTGYPTASATSGNGESAQVVTGFPAAGVAGLVAGGIAVAAAAGAFFYYRRIRAGDRSYQYATLDVSGAMATISTPVDDAYGGMSADGTGSLQAGPPASRSGEGFLSSVRGLFSGGGANKAAFGARGAGLAETGFSEVEDQVAGYM
jgi:hypothetical protein